MNFVKPLCDKLRWFKPPLLGAGPVVPAGSRNHLTGINCCDWWTFGLGLGWGINGAEAFAALLQVFPSFTICISSFLPPSLCSHCKRVTVSVLSSLLKVKIRQISQGPNNPALRRSHLSPGGRWRGHSSVRPIGGSTVVLCIYLDDTESLSGWMSQWSLTNTRIWNLPLTGWNPGSVLLHGQTSHDFSTPGLSSAWNYFSLKHSIETYCSSVWFIWITPRKLINPLNFWLKVNK